MDMNGSANFIGRHGNVDFIRCLQAILFSFPPTNIKLVCGSGLYRQRAGWHGLGHSCQAFLWKTVVVVEQENPENSAQHSAVGQNSELYPILVGSQGSACHTLSWFSWPQTIGITGRFR